MSIMTNIPAPAPKFKVGDRVAYFLRISPVAFEATPRYGTVEGHQIVRSKWNNAKNVYRVRPENAEENRGRAWTSMNEGDLTLATR
jgi:hypothetical protein